MAAASFAMTSSSTLSGLSVTSLLAEELVVDRWSDFQRIARSKGSLPVPGALGASGGIAPPGERRRKRDKILRFAEAPSDSSLMSASGSASSSTSLEAPMDLEAGRVASAAAAAKPSFMREFFDEVGEVQGSLRRGQACVREMDAKLEEVMTATAQDAQRLASEELTHLADETNGHIADSKRGLDALREATEAFEEEARGGKKGGKSTAAERRIRRNMQQAMAKKHQQLLLDFQKAQTNFKQVLVTRQAREMQLLYPQASPDEVAQMIEAGETSTQLVVRRMAGAHASILDEVQRIRDKHEDIVRLERSIQDLAQMFQEMAVLVEVQGELLDSIEQNVENVVEYTGDGAKQLETTLKIQRSTRKWHCCLMVFCTVLLVVILFPILFR